MLQIFSKYSDRADFLAIYIAEAHATDEWKLGNQVKIAHHKNIHDRISAAKLFQSEKDYQISLVIDSMENDFESKYASWPERGFVIYEGKMAYISNMDIKGSIDWEIGIKNWLIQHFDN